MSKNRFLDGRHNLLPIVLIIFIVAIIISFVVGGFPLVLATIGGFGFTLWISQSVWASPNHGKLIISLAILSLVAFLSGAVIQQANHWFVCLLPILKQPELPWIIKIENFLNCFTNSITVEPLKMAIVFIFDILSIYFVLQVWRDRTSIQKNTNSIEPEFGDKYYQERVKYFRDVLKKNPGYSNDRSFSESHFIPLQAEIETTKKNQKIRKKVDLLTFINSEIKTKNILLLGNSGAGKSCTLSALEKIFGSPELIMKN